MATTQTRTDPPTVLITGATDGIGLALARRYHARQAKLILVGRRPLNELDASFFDATNYCQVNLAEPDAADRIAVWLECADIRRLDYVYLNAAVGFVGDIAGQEPPNIEHMLGVNLWTPIALTHHLAPMVAAQQGVFVFVSSVAAAMPSPDYAVYSATKAALEGFVRSLRTELRAQRSPIRIALVRPGATNTGMHSKSGADLARMDWTRFPPAERTATALEHAVERNRRTTNHTANLGPANNLIHWTGRHAGGIITATMRRRLPPPEIRITPTQAAKQPHVAITGGAAGIGAAVAQVYATADTSAGSIITLIDVDQASAAAAAATLRAAGAEVNIIQADLSTRNGCQAVVRALAELPPLTLFVHSADISSVGPFLASSLPQQQRVIAVNLLAPILLTAGLIRHQLLAPGGSLVFISSLSHYVSYPGAAVYAATKDGVASFATSLRAGARRRARHVLTVYPGPTRTDHVARHSPDNACAHKRMPPQDIAVAIQRAVTCRREHLIPGIANRLTAAAARFMPPFIEFIMARTIFAKLVAPLAAPDSNPRTLP